MKLLAGFILAYLLGSIPTGYLVGRFVKHVDIRTLGSGNVGATNVFRVVGKGWGIGVLLFDILKGFLAATVISQYLGSPRLPFFLNSLILGLAAIAGHTWTVWLRFRGGKGVATALGVFGALTPPASGAALSVWTILFVWKRYVSLASLGAALSFPFWIVLFYRERDFFPLLLPIGILLTLFTFYTHRANIQRLREGTEKRLI